MPANITSQTQLDDALTVFIADAVTLSEHTGVMKKLVDSVTLPKKSGRNWSEPWFTPVSAVSLTDGIEFDSPVQVTDSKITITPGEVGVQIYWTNRADMTITENFASFAAKLMVDSLERKRDQDLLTLLDGFSTSLGGATVTYTAGLVSAATALLRGGRSGALRAGALPTGDMAPGPYRGVVHPYHVHDDAMQRSGLSGVPTQYGAGVPMVGNYGGQSLSEANVRAIENAEIGRVGGATMYVDGNFTISSNSIKGGVFSQMALVHVDYQGLKQKKVETDDGRLIKHTMLIDYGTGERADNYGIELFLDCTAPAT